MVELTSYWDGHGHESYIVRLLGSQHPTGPAAMYWAFLLFLPSGPLGRGEGGGGESWRQELIKKDRQCHLMVRPMLLQSPGSRARLPTFKSWLGHLLAV